MTRRDVRVSVALDEGLTYASIHRLQRRYRALYVVIGLAMVAALISWKP